MKTFTTLKSITLLLFFCTFSVFGQKLTRTEKKILKSIEANNAEAIQFLKDVVKINSGTMNHEDVKKVGDGFSKALDKNGIDNKWYVHV